MTLPEKNSEPEIVVDDDGVALELIEDANIGAYVVGEDESEAYADVEVAGVLAPESHASGELVRYDPLESYLSEIRHIPILNKEQEKELSIRFKEQGDKVAGYKLVVSNLRLVVMIAREYQKNLNNLLDLIQEGNVGLLEAVKHYDPYREIRFSSYAVYWIRAYMLRYLINNVRLVKVGTTQSQRKLFFNLQKEKDRLESEGFIPEAKLLADRLHVKESEVIEMEQRLALPDLSVDAPVSQRDSSSDFHDILPIGIDGPEALVGRQQLMQKIREAVNEFRLDLGEKEKAILDMRLFTDEPATLQLIAEQYGLSRERIRQLESRLKGQLKQFLVDKLGVYGSEDLPVLDA